MVTRHNPARSGAQARPAWPRAPFRVSIAVEEGQQKLIQGGHRVPRWDVMTVGNRDDVEPVAWGFQGGRWFRCPFGRLDARVLETFDEEGPLVAVVEGDLMASESMEARFLLQVLQGAMPGDPDRVGPVPTALRDLPGALLSDSRNRVPVPEGEPVITDPAEA